MFTLQLLLGLTLCLWICILWTRRKYYMLLLKIPGPCGYPILGMAPKLMLREEILQTFEENTKKYGPIFLSWLGPFPFVVISEPQIAQDILTSPYCVNKGIIYAAVGDGAGQGLFSLKNPEWSAHRKLLNPAFGHKVLLTFMPIFNDEVNGVLASLDTLIGKGETDLTNILQELTLNIAAQTTMGKNVSKETNSQNESLLNCYQCVLENMTEMCFAPWLNIKVIHWLLGKRSSYERAKKVIRRFIGNLIHEKLKKNSVANVDDMEVRKDKNVFINLAIDLLKKGEFSWQDVENESNVIVFGAFETTSNTIAYTLMLLSMFPKYQQKAFEEILSIFPDSGSFDVTYADTQQMVYMDMILNEAMRLMAPVPIISRQAADDVQLSNGVTIPKGAQIAIDIFHMHRRKDIWGPEAHTFNPDNFLPSNMDGKHAYAFIPFTKGIRNCIGWKYALLSTKLTLAKLIRNYRFTTSFNFQDLYFVEDITIKLKKVPLLELHKRTRNIF